MAKRISKRKRYRRLPREIREAGLINWKLSKSKKVPVDPNGRILRKLNTNPIAVDFVTAVRAVERGKASGIGLTIVGNDYIALDLDDCIVDGEIAPWAQDILVECDSYAEFSPSGTGIHILMKGKQTNE
jgi:putative DNA primase/helicase